MKSGRLRAVGDSSSPPPVRSTYSTGRLQKREGEKDEEEESEESGMRLPPSFSHPLMKRITLFRRGNLADCRARAHGKRKSASPIMILERRTRELDLCRGNI